MNKHKQYKQWNEQEDDVIKKLVDIYGTKQWTVIAQEMQKRYGYKNRTGKQCRQRWHNHLDPSINKDAWQQEEERIMFQEHGKHGNKWTIIAEKLPGRYVFDNLRNDNAIKNHFYSTVRRSIRRISKILGSKNSTTQMRNIKPSTLSRIFSIVTGNDSQYSMVPQQKMSSDHQNQVKLLNQNPAAYKLKAFLSQNCQNLAQNIMEFANYKPTKKNSEVLKKNSKKRQRQRSKKNKEDDLESGSQELNEQFESFKGIIDKIIKINCLYEKAQVVQRRKRREYLQSRGKDFDQYSDEGDIEEDFEQPTPQHTKTPIPHHQQSRFLQNCQEQEISQEVINLPKQSVRSKRTIKTPSLYEPTIKLRKHRQSGDKSQNNIGKQKESNSEEKQRRVQSEKHVSLITINAVQRQMHDQRAVFENNNDNPFKSFQIENPNQNDQIQYPLQYQSFVISVNPQLAFQIAQLSIKQSHSCSNEQNRMDLLSPRAYSPYFSFPTPTGLTPKGNLFRERSNLSSFGSISGFNNQDLDNYVNAFKKQTEFNMENYERGSANEGRIYNQGSSSYIAPSPKSAFKLYQ